MNKDIDRHNQNNPLHPAPKVTAQDVVDWINKNSTRHSLGGERLFWLVPWENFLKEKGLK